jgi:pyruvate formate lyase activating enzyme
LTLVSAPAGFGKSTLVTGWLAEMDFAEIHPAAAWLSLDEGDNDPVRFWTYVIAAIQAVDQEVGDEAREIIGSKISVEQLIESVLRDRIFFDESGGGATFSGGEPLAQPEFLQAVLLSCTEKGIHTVVDTCGYCDKNDLLKIAELVDLFLFDLKVVDSELHKRLTGVELEPILDNLETLAATGQPMWLRIPVVPGMTDRSETVERAVQLATQFPNIGKINLLPYHRTGYSKMSRLGEKAVSTRIESPSEECLRQLAKANSSLDVAITVGG